MKPTASILSLRQKCLGPMSLVLVVALLGACASPGVMKFSTFEKLAPFRATVEKIKVSPFSGSYYTNKRAGDTEVDVTIHLRKEDGSKLVVRKRTFAMSKGLRLYPPLRKLAEGKTYTFPTDISGPDALE